MRFIGDVHAKFQQYLDMIQDCQESIQVGDFGLGFREPPLIPEGHRFIRGNHDDPQACRQHPRWIADGSVLNDVFFLGGGESIDRHSRVQGVSWWPDEQLSMSELYQAMDAYEQARPRILVCHECPSDVTARLFQRGHVRINNPSRTSQALSGMVYQWQPEIVIFGHWHQRRDEVINGVRYICLEELGWIDLDV